MNPWRINIALLVVASFGLGTVTGACSVMLLEDLWSPRESKLTQGQCLPGDRCTLHIEPKDAPWLNLTCDLITSRCYDDPPKLDSCQTYTTGPNSTVVECILETK